MIRQRPECQTRISIDIFFSWTEGLLGRAKPSSMIPVHPNASTFPSTNGDAYPSASHALMSDSEDCLGTGATAEAVEDNNSTHSVVESPELRELAACVAFFLACTLPFALLKSPRQRPMPIQRLNDGEIVLSLVHNEIFEGDTISDSMLIFLAAIFPLGLQLLLGRLVLGNPRDMIATGCVYAVAFGLTNGLTGTLKLYCGYLRPVFFQLCKPDNNMDACTTTNVDARKSFPSGHASLSFCGLMLLSRFVHARFGVASSKTTNSHRRCMSIVSLLPLGLATFIAASRVVDNRHFPADIVAGAVLGGSLARFVHDIWFVDQQS